MLTFIKTFFTNHKYAIIVTGLVIVFAIANFVQFNQKQILQKKVAVAEQNLGAANDTIRVTKDRNGKLEYDKLSFLTSKMSDLEKINTELYKEVKETKGTVNTIIKAGVTIVHDTIPLTINSNVSNGKVTSNFNFDTAYSPGNYHNLRGYTEYDLQTGKSKGELSLDEIAFTATTGIREINGKREIFFKPDYPGLTVTKLQGAQIDANLFSTPKPSLVNLSVSIGYLPVVYNWQTGRTDIFGSNLGINAGLSVNINRLFKK